MNKLLAILLERLINMENKNPIISLKNLYSIYNQNNPNYFVANKDINYDFQPNKTYFIIGNSGSGKSTLIHHFNGLKMTKYGSCVIDGRDIGTNFNLQGYFLGKAKLNDLESSIRNFVKFKLEKNKNLKLHVLAFNVSTSKDIARIFINAMYNHNPKFLHVDINHKKHIKYFYFYTDKELVVYDECSWGISENNNGKKMPLSLSIKQKWKSHHIKKVKEIRKKVAIVFQFPEYQLFKDQIIKDVIFGPINLGIKKPQAIEDAKKYLKMLNMPESYYTHSPFGLSGGQKRRVAIAGILSIKSDVIVFDEPTAGLDPAGENEMLKIISDLKNNEKKIVVVISHNMDHVLQEADEVLVLNKGVLVKSGNPYEIFSNEEDVKRWGLNVPYVIKTYHDILNRIENKSHKEKLTEMMLKNKPKDINEFSSLLNEFFIKLEQESFKG